MRVLLASEAEADLQATLEYLHARNPGAALKLAERVFGTLAMLADGGVDGPEYRLTTGEVVRGWLIPPFRVYYQRREDALHVLRVYHHARRPVAGRQRSSQGYAAWMASSSAQSTSHLKESAAIACS